MTNEQLLILLYGLRDELNLALEEARASVIDALDRPPVLVKRHIVPPGAVCFNPHCERPDHYQEVEEDADMTELLSIEVFVRSLNERIDLLRR